MQRILSILLSLLLLFSSTGITYAQHFCGEHMMMDGITLGKQDLSCGMVVQSDDCESESQEPMGCCDNEYTSVDTDDSVVTAEYVISYDLFSYTLPSSLFELLSWNIQESKETAYPCYRPPPNITDLQVAYQSFLI
ncbi:MAG: hypothetical protein ABJM06_13720 [Gilvibacter sp.]